MKTSTDRILTTHVGSIPRPETIRALLRARLAGQPVDEVDLATRAAEAVTDVVRRQAQAGLDVVSDGEMSKTSFLAYTDERLTGFSRAPGNDPSALQTGGGRAWTRRVDSRREWRAFREYYTEYLPREMPLASAPTVCDGPIAYKGQALLQKDLSTLKAALEGVNVVEAFVPAIAPAMVGRGQNRYYPTEEAYVFAIAEALKTEYRAIVEAGFILQIDDPGLGETWDMLIPAPPLEDYRKTQVRNIEALNHALAGIPEDRVRYHLCWGSWQGPHLHDLGLRDIVDLVLRVRAQAYSIEAATPRHSYEWQVWKDVPLPEGKVLVPGVIAHTTAVVEHPETVAERLMNFASLVGRERVIAGADCGFAQGALFQRQHPTIMWAKFEALVTGARLASDRLWR
ncbi:MAG TPA: cobalamin-independent methionine synthase II family protein [Candidatus Methylomirabilis sp.]|nr:cobalamin-independent methionine synthase II family protein [Candidatus Methylomirabilis sp.]